tara:strand:- start:260 stop:496 length:237 start_codon:yes stop_codon:yes gene_type:complete
MSRVSELIDLIVQGKNSEASEVLNSELMARSYEGINEIKPQVAADYFAPVVNYDENGGEPSYEHPEVTQEEPEDETDS